MEIADDRRRHVRSLRCALHKLQHTSKTRTSKQKSKTAQTGTGKETERHREREKSREGKAFCFFGWVVAWLEKRGSLSALLPPAHKDKDSKKPTTDSVRKGERAKKHKRQRDRKASTQAERKKPRGSSKREVNENGSGRETRRENTAATQRSARVIQSVADDSGLHMANM